MARSVLATSFRCIGDIVRDCWRFLRRQMSAGEVLRAWVSHIRTAWSDIRRPPTTEDRKLAMHRLNEGIRLYNQKRYDEALRAFKDAVSEDPNYGRAHLYHGNTLYKLHRQEEALAEWERTVRVDPHSEAADKAREKLDLQQAKNHQAIRDIQAHLKKH